MCKSFRLWLLLVCGLVVALIGSQMVSAQTQATGTIEGLIRDERGAVITGAKVSARHLGTNALREVLTDASGRYRIVFLPPGSYEVTAEMPGFATVTQSGITVLVGGTATVDLTLKVAPVAETVTVTAEAPIVEPERTEFTSVVNESAVHNLPINGRRWENFVLLTPGVNPDGTFGLVSYRGISGLYNNNTVDGADNNQAFFSEARGRTRVVYTTSLSSTKEFQVGLSNFSAEFGRAAGGTVNAVTKSGTNEFHGEAFYFLRDDAIMAREPFQPLEPEERRQQFGFSLGGPFIKDKLFYFGTYDQQVRNFPYFVTPSSPTFLTSPCTAPGCAATIQFFQSLQRFVPRKAHNNVAFFKIDWVISPRHTFTGQYNWHRWRSPNGIRTAPIQFAAESDNGFDGVKTDFLLFRLSSALSNTLAHETRFQYGRDFEFQRPNAPGPSTTVTGGISFGMPSFLPRPAFPDEKRFQWVENISLIRGRHNLKAGLDINYVRDLQINLFQGGGVYSYDGLNQIAQDCPKGAVGCIPLDDGPRTRRHYRFYVQAFDLRGLTGEQAGRVFFTTTDYNFYVQDRYRAHPHLTLDFGVRYEFQKLPQPERGNPAFPQTERFNQDTNNFGPRVGIAWDIGGHHTTVLRAGYGLYYGRTSNSAIANALTNNGKVIASFFFTPTTPGAPLYPDVFSAPPAGPGSAPDIQFFSSDYARPLVHMAELSFEREILRDLSVSASYLFSRGQRLPSFRDLNLNPPRERVVFILPDGTVTPPLPFFTGSRPVAGVGRIIISESVVKSSYNAFVLQVTQRMRHGVQFNANLTIAKAIDDGQTSATFFGGNQLFNTFDRRSERALSNFDIRKRFVTSFVWEPRLQGLASPTARAVLNGWRFSGIVTASDGVPVTGVISGSLSAATGATVTTSPNGSGGSTRVPFLARNSFRGSGFANVDFRIARDIKVTEGTRFEIIWEAFNLFNRVNFTSFSTIQYRIASSGVDPSGVRQVRLAPDPGFLRPRAASTTLWGPREFQLAIKFHW